MPIINTGIELDTRPFPELPQVDRSTTTNSTYNSLVDTITGDNTLNLADFERYITSTGLRSTGRRVETISQNEDIYSFADIMKAGRSSDY